MGSREIILLGVQMLLLLSPPGCGKSPPTNGGESPTEYVRSRVFVPPRASSRWKPVSLEITDAAQVTRLASLFSGLGEGRVARVAGDWRLEVGVTFFTKNGEELHVLISQDLRFWSEGHGDWEVTPECRAYLEELLVDAETDEKQPEE